MIFFPPLATCRFSTPIVALLPWFFPILHLFYPFISPFPSPFLFLFPLSSFFFPLSSFFFCFLLFFLFSFSYFFPQMTLADISPRGCGIFQYIDPLYYFHNNSEFAFKIYKLRNRVQWFLKLTMLHVVLDQQNISKTIFRKGIFLYFVGFYLFRFLCCKIWKSGSSERWNLFSFYRS